MRKAVIGICTSTLVLLALGGCGSAPTLPTVQDSQRHPVNSDVAVQLQQCRSDLHSARINAAESSRLAQTTSAALGRATSRRSPDPAASAPNTIFTVRFARGSPHPVFADDAALVEAARAAPLVLLRAAAGALNPHAPGRIARRRVAAVRDHLIQAGVDAGRIRVAYRPTRERTVADPGPSGSALNRDMEIEVYRWMPVVHDASACAQR
jgi:hypothetical protein